MRILPEAVEFTKTTVPINACCVTAVTSQQIAVAPHIKANISTKAVVHGHLKVMATKKGSTSVSFPAFFLFCTEQNYSPS